MHLWQVLPLTPTGFGDSPYQCLSAFAGNTLLVSPDKLVEQGFLDADDIQPLPRFAAERVNFGRVIDWKSKILAKAFSKFQRTTDTILRAHFLSFCNRTSAWLEDYALFRVLKDAHDGLPWNRWERELAHREPAALETARESMQEQIEAEKFYQFLFFTQWQELRDYCHEKQVAIIGDLPIFVAYDSADVWMQPQYFKLNDECAPIVVAGVPPDYFSATGQLWGNPIYDWALMKEDGFQWWIERISTMLEVIDIVRIDHFRGFAACWEIPGGDTTAERGRWVEVPGRELFTTLNTALGELPIIAEDLGVITPDVEALRDDFQFPGMRVLQMAFRGDSCNIDLPHNHVPNAVVYTGTHDNDTIVGWFNSKPGAGSTRTPAEIKRERTLCLRYLKSDGDEINWDFIDTAFRSVARLAIIPLQDILGLGSEARMNLPASNEGNWSWRFRGDALTSKTGKRLKELVKLYDRDHAFTPAKTPVATHS
jgi:4-alpha-glucanotransferase